MFRWPSTSTFFTVTRSVSFKSRKTGRICGNCVLPRQAWRYDRAVGRGFQRTIGRRFGYDLGLEDRLLLASLGQRQRHLDAKKRKQLESIISRVIEEATSTNEAIADRALQFSKVKVNNSFTEISVYWMCDGVNDEETEAILDQERHSVRRSLSDSIGTNCPEVKFYPDKTNLLFEEMDRLFKKADYGVDYRTLSPAARVLGNVRAEAETVPEKRKIMPEWRRKYLEKKGLPIDDS